MQDVPSLLPSPVPTKSLLCQRRNFCLEVKRIGVAKFFHMISEEFELYPSILYLWPLSSTLGIRISLLEFVKSTIKFLVPQPQFDHRPFDTLQDTFPWRWTSLTASIWPLTSTINEPNLLSLAPKHTGFEFSLRHRRSAINKNGNTGKILKNHVILLFQLETVGVKAVIVPQESTIPRNCSKNVIISNGVKSFTDFPSHFARVALAKKKQVLVAVNHHFNQA